MSEQINGLTNDEANQTNKITEQGLIADTENLVKSFEPILHTEVLESMLNKIQKINFREKANIESDTEKLRRKHYLILCIEEILSVAKSNNWGICRDNGFIYLYNGSYWSLIADSEMQWFLGCAAEKMSIDKFDAKFYSFKEQLFRQFLSTSNLPKPKTFAGVVYINLMNGTFEISPTLQKIREPRSEDFLKHQLPFEFNKDATSPLFQKFLDKVLPEKEKQLIIAEFFGYIFIKNCVVKLEKALILYGNGANGKSVIFEIIYALLGRNQNVSNYSLCSLTDDKGYHRANLANKLLNYAPEISGNLEASIFKQLVSGEPVEARLPYGDPFILTDYAKLVFNCNELPIVTEHTHAFFRRFTIIHFDVTIKEEEQDKELAKKIIDNELSGVFNWILDGLDRLLKNKKLTYSESVENQLNIYKMQSDTVQLFLEEERYVKSPDEYLSLKDIFMQYKCYCSENLYKPCSLRKFSERLKNLNFMTERKSYGYVLFAKKNV